MLKRILIAFVVLMTIVPTVSAETATRLMGVGVPEEQAKRLASDKINTFKVVNSTGTPVAQITPSTGTFVTAGGVTASGAISGTTGAFSGDVTMSSGKGVVQAVAIITPNTNMTPAAGSNMSATVNRFVAGSPTLAAANLPAAGAATIGKEYKILNEGSYPVLVFPTGTDTIGAAAAGTPHSCASTKICDCIGKSATAWQCGTK